MSSADTVSPSTAEAAKFDDRAFSASAQRKTPLLLAPVTATRTPSLNLATKTPVRAKRLAGWLNFT